MRSGGSLFDRKVTVQVRHCDLELAVEVQWGKEEEGGGRRNEEEERGTRRRKEEEGGGLANIKSSNLHLASGEQPG